jgi:hypothetical protein
MLKVLKITTRLILVMGLIILSFRPSVSNRLPFRLLQAPHQTQQASSDFTTISKRTPLTANSTARRCNFEKTENRNRLPVAVVAIQMADVFAFNTLRFNPWMSSISSVTASSPSQTVVLRI